MREKAKDGVECHVADVAAILGHANAEMPGGPIPVHRKHVVPVNSAALTHQI